MFRFVYLLFSVLLCSIVAPVAAQNSIDDTQVYGLEPILHNGEVYNYFPGVGVKGHQYFEQKDFIEGTISVRGTTYENVFLNYDILNQQVILKYLDPQGSNRLLAVSKAWLEKFSIGEEQFSVILKFDGQKIIVQTLNEGSIQLHIQWTKKLVADISFVSEYYTFDKKHQTLYISYNNTLQEYKNTKTILALLNPSAQEKVKKYMRLKKIKNRSNSMEQLNELLVYCNQLGL